MAAWCLPPSLASKFLAALKDGTLSPDKLLAMTSEERRAAFAEHVGEEFAKNVNSEFETKMLLADQKAGLISWAKKTGGLTEAARSDIIATINKLERVLDPEEERDFLSDLAARKLGVSVTSQEAKEIFQLAQKAEQLRTAINDAGDGNYRAGWTVETGTAYGRAQQALLDKIESLKPNGQTVQNALAQVLNAPKAALTSILHFSAPFVQGWGMISTRQWWSGLAQMFQYFADEGNYQNLQAYIVGHPDYAIAKDARLGLTDLTDRLSTREEQMQSTLVEQLNNWISEKTGAPNLVRASSRSFTGFLNYVRFNRYTQLLDAARLSGEDVSLGSRTSHDLASVVNNFTGRGELGKDDKFAGIAPVLNGLFFAPRKVVATIEMFNPVAYVRLSPTARMAAIRQLSGSLIATGAVLTLAKLGAAQVNFDPRSSDFAKVNIGGEKFDMTGGNAAYLRMLARIATGQALTQHGQISENVMVHGHQLPTRAGAFINFVMGKMSPVASTIADALFGKDAAGRAFDLPDKLRDEFTPIVINSFIQFAMNNPDDTAAYLPALSAFLGVEMESPLPPASHNGMNVWGDPLPGMGGSPPSWRNDPVNKEAERIGVRLDFPMNKIRGVPLTPSQFDQYVQTSGRLAHMRLEQVIQSQGWSAVPEVTKAKTMRSIIRSARDAAATGIMIQSQGSSNDIIKKAADAKMAASAAL